MQEQKRLAFYFDRLAYTTNNPLPEAQRRKPREALHAQRIRRNDPAEVGLVQQAPGGQQQRGFAH